MSIRVTRKTEGQDGVDDLFLPAEIRDLENVPDTSAGESVPASSTAGEDVLASKQSQLGRSDKTGPSRTAVARQIGRYCEWHWIASTKAERLEGVARCRARFKQQIQKRESVKTERQLNSPWSIRNDDLNLGRWLLLKATERGIIEIIDGRTRRNRPTKIVAFTASFARAFIDHAEQTRDFTAPLRRPMICAPISWSEKLRGGYLLPDPRGCLPLIKPNIATGSISGIIGTDYSAALDAINALQNSRWKVNKRLLEKMQALRRSLKDPNNMLDENTRERLGLVCTSEKTPERFRIDGKCEAVVDVKDEPEIFFPYQFDYRGRVYPIPTGVNPQQDDIGRSLLTFSTPRPLGRWGWYWLAVHLANSWNRDVTITRKPKGLSKMSYKERVRWVLRNESSIRNSAKNPQTSMWWTKAEKPWRFLAACIEWDRYRSCSGEFLSDLPVTIDGTCNGLQHIAALRRDSSLADMTNLRRCRQPGDMYEVVAAKLKKVVEDDKASGNKLADYICDTVQLDRDFCKKAVMTTPYGAGNWGKKMQLFESPLTDALHIPGDGPICVGHVQNYRRLRERLLAQNDARVRILYNRLSPDIIKAIETSEVDDGGPIDLFVKDLNRIIEGPSLYCPTAFTEVSKETQELVSLAIKSGRQGLTSYLFSKHSISNCVERKRGE